MFNPRRWKWNGAKGTPTYEIVDDAGTKVAEAFTLADATLIRCAPDAHEFLVKLLDSPALGRDDGPTSLRAEARRLRHRMEGLQA